jgi:acetoin utilization deacetylase AcuC-like enzyme
VLLLSDELMVRHDPGPGHPERPERLRAAQAALEDLEATRVTPTRATRAQIARVHEESHIDRVDSLHGRVDALDPDTSVSEHSVDAAYLAAGALVDATAAVTSGDDKRAFALVRPPGHHAEAQVAMGFCLFNNVAVAAAHAVAELGLERVLIVDWDVHHGNGTQHMFEARRDILFCSLHQYPFYPGSGAPDEQGRSAGEGYNVNVGLPAGCGPGDYLAAFDDVVLPIADAFAPQLVLVSAGFDAHRRDPLAGMELESETYADLTDKLLSVAERHADGRIVLCLEGGYDLKALGQSVRACADVLCGVAAPGANAEPTRGADAIAKTRAVHRPRWSI